MVKSYKVIKMLFHNIFNNDIIYIISEYTGKKWSINFTPIKKYKVKNGKKEKQRYSFHYYYN